MRGMKSTQQKMEACMDRDVITLSNHTHIPTPLQSLSLLLLLHPPTNPPSHQLPLQTPNHAIIGKVTPQSAQPLQFISHKRVKIKSHSNLSQHTALHSQAITGTLERGWLREGGRGGACGQIFSVKPLLGTSPVQWASSDPLLVHWSAGSREQP